MTEEEFDLMLEAAKKQHAPQEQKWKNWVLNIVRNTPEDAQYLLAPRLPALFNVIARCLAEWRVDEGDRVLAAFELQLQNDILRERQVGKLKPVRASDELARWVGELQEHAFNGFETEGVLTLMPDGVRIQKVDYDAVHLADGTTITRRDLREKLRPPSIFQSRWDLNFTSQREIDAAREEKARREAPQPPSAGPLDENGRPLQGREVFE